jgi:hypothetical protein
VPKAQSKRKRKILANRGRAGTSELDGVLDGCTGEGSGHKWKPESVSNADPMLTQHRRSPRFMHEINTFFQNI